MWQVIIFGPFFIGDEDGSALVGLFDIYPELQEAIGAFGLLSLFLYALQPFKCLIKLSGKKVLPHPSQGTRAFVLYDWKAYSL